MRPWLKARLPPGPSKAWTPRPPSTVAGVLLVLTHRNAPKLAYSARDGTARGGTRCRRGTTCSAGCERYCSAGKPIGVVVAKSQSQAEYAASLVQVTYDVASDPVTRFDLSKAQPASAAAEKKGRGPESRRGDADGALTNTAFKVDQTYTQPREHHNAMEPHATVALWRENSLTLWDKTQWVYNDAEEIARVFGIPATSVCVINPYIGGAFGSALRTWPHVTLAALAARQVKRPVRLELSRRQLYYSVGFRPRAEQRVQLGAGTDGRLQALIQEALRRPRAMKSLPMPHSMFPRRHMPV